MNSAVSENTLGNDDTGLAFLAGILGYVAGTSKNAAFQPLIDQFNKRLEALKYFSVIPPYGFLESREKAKVLFREGTLSYLFGLPNVCMPSLVRILEIGLKEKYREVEDNEPTDKSLNDLLDWTEKKLQIDTMTAHSYRKIRNLIHTDELVIEQDCLEALRHICNIINNIFFVTPEYLLHSNCTSCKTSVQSRRSTQNLILGSTVTIQCPVCHINYNWTIVSV